MELIIVVTTQEYNLWETTENWSEKTIDELKVRYKKFDGNIFLLFCHATSDEDTDAERIRDIKKKTTLWVITAAESFQDAESIYIAAHSERVDWESIRQELGKKLKGYTDFTHESSDQIYMKICNLIESGNQKTYQELKEIIKKKHKPLTVQEISVLKYRIAYLFLPIDIDAQGLIEAKGDAQYWGDAGNPYTNEKLKNLWEQAKQLVYGDGQQDAVKKVVNEAKEKASNAAKERICRAWEKVTTLLPDNEPPEVITQIFQDLGEAGSVDLKKLTCHWKQFHDWLVSLCEAMDELRDEVEKVERAK